MRIGVVGGAGPDRFAQNIADALRTMGHTVTPLGSAHPNHRSRRVQAVASYTRMAVPTLDERSQRGIARAGLLAGCEIVINVDLRLMPATVALLKRDGARIAFWFPDAVSNLGRQLMILAPYDAIFFKEPHIVERLRANLDLPVYYLPQACNPRWHRPLVPAGTERHLVIAGNLYPARVRLLERLLEKGIPLKVYGPRVPSWVGETLVRQVHAGCSVYREEKARIFRAAAGVLNSMHPAEVTGVNSRLFEAAGCGGAVLTEFRPTLPELFSIGNEVLPFHDFDELLDQATRLLNERDLGTRLGDAAALRARQDHTYEQRLNELLKLVS